MQKQLPTTCMPQVRGGQTFSTNGHIGKNVKAEGRSAWKSKAKKGHHLERIQKVLVGGCNFELG